MIKAQPRQNRQSRQAMSRNCGHVRPSTLSAKGRSCTRPQNAQSFNPTGWSSGGCRVEGLELAAVADQPLAHNAHAPVEQQQQRHDGNHRHQDGYDDGRRFGHQACSGQTTMTMKMAKAAGSNTISPHERAPSRRMVAMTNSRPPVVEGPGSVPLTADFPVTCGAPPCWAVRLVPI